MRIGLGRKRHSLKDVVLVLDQSGSMGSSVVYSGIFGAVMASTPAIKTWMVVFDTDVIDLTEELSDPVELLFGVQLGGGTDINLALPNCQQVVTRPLDTVLALVADLFEGRDAAGMCKRAAELAIAGVQLIVLLALNDDGASAYDHGNAQFLAVRVFACTDKFPDLMATALSKQDVRQWAAKVSEAAPHLIYLEKPTITKTTTVSAAAITIKTNGCTEAFNLSELLFLCFGSL